MESLENKVDFGCKQILMIHVVSGRFFDVENNSEISFPENALYRPE